LHAISSPRGGVENPTFNGPSQTVAQSPPLLPHERHIMSVRVSGGPASFNAALFQNKAARRKLANLDPSARWTCVGVDSRGTSKATHPQRFAGEHAPLPSRQMRALQLLRMSNTHLLSRHV